MAIVFLTSCSYGSGISHQEAPKTSGNVVRISSVPTPDQCTNYAHKSENEIESLSVAQKLDEAIKESACHRIHNEYYHLFEKSFRRAGVTVFPELIRRFTEDSAIGNTDKHNFESFFVLVLTADDLDDRVIRLRGTEQGRLLIDSLESALDRMKKRNVDQKHLHQFDEFLRNFRGLNVIDQYVANTLEESHNIRMADKEKLEFSNFLVSIDPSYPTWSAFDEKGVLILKDSKKFHLAYLEFKKLSAGSRFGK